MLLFRCLTDNLVDNAIVPRTLRSLSSLLGTRKHKDVLLSEPDSFRLSPCRLSASYLEVGIRSLDLRTC
jgi:hypothetical protein